MAELRARDFPVELFEEARLTQYSGVIFSKLYDEENYRLAQSLKRRGKAVVFDICDNHFYNPWNLKTFKIVREQLLKMVELADLVVASTPTLADVLIEEARLTSVPAVIGDAVEESEPPHKGKRSWIRFAGKEEIRREGIANILWFGIHGGDNAPYGMLDVLHQTDLLIELGRTYPLQLVIVSDSRKKFKQHIQPLPLRTLYIEWGSIPFGEVLRQSDVCIIPISLNPFTLCKTNNRLATALFRGVSTVADEIPSYSDLAPYCVLNDWERGLRLYLDDRSVAQGHTEAAKTYVRERYTIKPIADAWAEHLAAFVD
jgi:hypothetical protein